MNYNTDLNKVAEELDFDLEDVEMLFEAFLEGAEESLVSLNEAINQNNFEGIYTSAHAIKGSAANLTLTDISELAREIENSGRASQDIDYSSKYNELKNLINNI